MFFNVLVLSVSRCAMYTSSEALGCECLPQSRMERSVVLKKWMLDYVDSEVKTEFLAIINWDNFGFGLCLMDAMFVMKCELGGLWKKGEMSPLGNLELSLTIAFFNYGQVRFCSMFRVNEST